MRARDINGNQSEDAAMRTHIVNGEVKEMTSQEIIMDDHNNRILKLVKIVESINSDDLLEVFDCIEDEKLKEIIGAAGCIVETRADINEER